MIRPLEKLQQEIDRKQIESDVAQWRAMQVLDNLAAQLESQSSIRLLGRAPLQGVYLWGSVGRGKTLLMDLFYECLPTTQKKRVHFHELMQTIHQHLTEHQGAKNPLKLIAKQWAKSTKIVCIDEFFVEDIADAMILGNLLQYFFEAGIVLVITSNRLPSELYKNGLQREKFLPAIEQIEKYNTIVNIDNEGKNENDNIDYRLRVLSQAELYHYPLDELAHQNLEKYFAHLAPAFRVLAQTSPEKLIIYERVIPTIAHSAQVVWFDFEVICASPRSAPDYLEIARRFQTVLVSNVKVMDAAHENMARRFIAMVDTFYDRNVKLILSAQTDLPSLYRGTLLTFEFQRTISRLTEMQSQSYLSKPHLG